MKKLAKLYISKEEENKLQKDLSEILEYVKVLEEVDVSDIEETSHSIDIYNILREDEVKKIKTEIKSIKVKGVFNDK